MQPKKQRKLKFSASIGGLFILLAVIGAITIIAASINFTRTLMDNKRQKEMFQKFIQPVVMFDPAAFSSPADIDMQRLLLYSMWSTLSNDKALDYKRSEQNQSLLVPASDLMASARTLFGESVKLQHSTFTDNESYYFYDEENSKYEVPTSGSLYVYSPEILDITKVTEKQSENGNDLYDLLVSYVAPDNAWARIYVGGVEQMTKKYMVYTMEKIDNGWNLVSISYPPAEILEKIPGAVVTDVYIPPELPEELPRLGTSGDEEESSEETSVVETSS